MAGKSRVARWLWFLGLWVAGVGILGIVAFVIRLAIP